MRVYVVSDTHGSVTSWRKIIDITGESDLFFHLGDVLYHGPRNPIPEGYDPKTLAEELKKFRMDYVRGNCDADVDVMVLGLAEMPKVAEESIEGWKIVMIHGEDLEDEFEFLRSRNAQVLLRGHTHIPKMEIESGMMVLNPGSPSLPKGGFPPTFAILDIEKEVLRARIVDLEGKTVMEGVLER